MSASPHDHPFGKSPHVFVLWLCWLHACPIAFGQAESVVGYWRFDDDGASNGGIITGSENVISPGTLDGSVISVPHYNDKVPGAIIYDPLTDTARTNQYSLAADTFDARFVIPNDASLNSEDFTIEFFIRLLLEADGHERYVERSSGSGSRSNSTVDKWKIGYDHTRTNFGRISTIWSTPGQPAPDWEEKILGGYIWVDTDSGDGSPASYSSGDPFPQGDAVNDIPIFHHVALVFDGSAKLVQIYTDGILVESMTLQGVFSHPNDAIEMGEFGGPDGVLLDEIRYTAAALVPAQFLTVEVPVIDDADLSDLTTSSSALTPAFDSTNTAYSASIPYAHESITVTPTSSDSEATIEVRINGGSFAAVISGEASELLPLNEGANSVDIKVTAEDNITVRTYSLTITRQPPSNNANLSSLTLSDSSISPSFDANISNYTAIVSNTTSSMMVTSFVEDSNATLKIRSNGSAYTSVDSGSPSAAFPLNVGPNTIDLCVTAEDSTVSIYSITIHRSMRVNTAVDEDNGVSTGGISLREAIAAVEEGGGIDFEPALDGLTIELAGTQIDIDKSLFIDASFLTNGITISGNHTSRAIKVFTGNAVAINRLSVIHGHVIDNSGAGILNNGTLSLTDLTVAGNTADGTGFGGGIYNNGTLTITQSTISNNTSAQGGGVFNTGTNAGTSLTNVTIAENTSTSSGGGIASTSNATLKLVSTSVAYNSALIDGGGIYLDGGSLELSNTLIAANTAPSKVDLHRITGNIAKSGVIVLGSNQSVSTEFPASPLIGTMAAILNPELAPLGFHGGLTKTLALASGSPAVDVGVSSSLTPLVDQRGLQRVNGLGLDVGAYESGDPGGGFHAWIAERLISGSDLSPGANNDNDRMVNLQEYGFQTDPAIWTADPESHEIVTHDVTGEDHLQLRFPHRLDGFDVIFEVRAADHLADLRNEGDHVVVYRFDNGQLDAGNGIPPFVEVMDVQSVSPNARRFMQLFTILK